MGVGVLEGRGVIVTMEVIVGGSVGVKVAEGVVDCVAIGESVVICGVWIGVTEVAGDVQALRKAKRKKRLQQRAGSE